MLSDFRYAMRTLARSPGFTLAAALSLALGIGATTTIFSLINAMLLRPLPVAGADQLVRVSAKQGDRDHLSLSYPEYKYLRDHSASFDGLTAHAPTNISLVIEGNAAPGWCEVASGNYFSALRIPLAVGRGLVEEEDKTAGTHAVAVISHGLWRRSFGGDSRAVGKAIKLNGRSFTVVGVAGEGFTGTFPGFVIDVWIPVMMTAAVMPQDSLDRADDAFLMVTGRLKPGTRRLAAQSELRTLAEQLKLAHPELSRDRRIAVFDAKGIHPAFARVVKGFLALLMGVAGLVLLIACANVANLLLARTTNRSAELAVRASLGATRLRLLRQLLAESVLLGLCGGALGLGLAVWGMYGLESFHPPTGVPIGFSLGVDWQVLGFAFVLSLLTGVVFGLAPAWRASRPSVIAALRGEAGFGGPRGSVLRNALVVAQVAVCLVLLAGAGLLGRSLLKLGGADPGFDPHNILAVSFEPHQVGYSAERAQEFYETLRRQLEAMPEVRAVTLALAVPLSDRGPGAHVYVAGKTPAAGRESPLVHNNVVAPDYFEVMNIPILRGRSFTGHDREGAPRVVVVSEAFARRYWPGENPLGKQMQMVNTRIWGQADPPMEVIGVARDIHYRSWAWREPMFYLPHAQHLRPDMVLHVRTARNPRSLLEPIRQMVRRLDEDLPIAGARPMAEAMAFSLVPARVAATVLGICGAAALLLAATGIFGVVAYAVSRQRREFGIRLALGAQRGDILRLVVGKGMLLAVTGTGIGLAAAAALAQLLKSMLYGIGPFDAQTFTSVAALLAGVALLACYVPARRAMRVDPAVALRYE